jgi:hypothetical protein
MVFSLLGMAEKLASVAIETEAAIQLVVEEAAGLVQETAKNALGTYEFGWPPLKEEPSPAKRPATRHCLKPASYATPSNLRGHRRDAPVRLDRFRGQAGRERQVPSTSTISTSAAPPRSARAA